MANSSVTGSGDGTRPTTSGGVDNIGKGDRLTGKRTAAGGEVQAPGPAERMNDKRKNVEGSKHDDSAAYGLREDLTPETNSEPPPAAPGRSRDRT